MTTKTIQQLSNKDLSSILNKFGAMSEMRPVLNYGYFNGNHMYATDSHKMITIDKSLIEYLNKETDNHLYDILQGEKSDSKLNYPEVEFLGNINNNQEFTIIKKQLTALHNTIKSIKTELGERYFGNVKLILVSSGNELMMSGYNSDNRTELYATGIEANNFEIRLGAALLIDAIVVYKKFLRVTGDKEIKVIYDNARRPIKLNLMDDKVSVLLMPLRY